MAWSLRFYVDGISLRVVLSQSFWLRVLPGGTRLFSQDGCQRGFREVVGHVVSPFDLSWTLLVGGGLLVPCSLPGSPVVKQLMQIVTVVPGQGGRVSISVLPLTQWLLEVPFKRTVHLKDNWNSPHQNKFKSQLTLSLMEAGQTLSKDSAERWRIRENEPCLGMSLPGDQLPEWQRGPQWTNSPTKKKPVKIPAKQLTSTFLDIGKLTEATEQTENHLFERNNRTVLRKWDQWYFNLWMGYSFHPLPPQLRWVVATKSQQSHSGWRGLTSCGAHWKATPPEYSQYFVWTWSSLENLYS